MWRTLSETDPNGSVTGYQYDKTGRVTRINYPNNGYETYAYNDTANTLTNRTVLTPSYKVPGWNNPIPNNKYLRLRG